VSTREGGLGQLVRLLATGQAESRAELARLSGLAPSSVSLRVEELLAAGVLREEGAGASRGGRRPRRLRLTEQAGLFAVADFGGHHARIALLDLTGTPIEIGEHVWDIAAGPKATASWLTKRVDELLAGDHPGPLQGVCVGLPGPVDPATGRVVSPSRMPGWSDFPIRERLSEAWPLPVVVENDANLMALGEHRRGWADRANVMVIKAGTGIGCGVIVDGHLHRGRGAAGDISHVRVSANDSVICACGHSDCLEAYASGAALVTALAEAGISVSSPSELVKLVTDGVPQATNLVRKAGRLIGEVLTVLVNFFNPDAVIIGGSLSAAEPLIAAIRGTVYERCLPLATSNLEIAIARTGRDATIFGAGALLIDEVLDAVFVNR
jgi:predicted NBD/HSP70 family sugar kinase